MNDTSKLISYVKHELAKQKEQFEASLSAGRAEDFAEYKYICGVIRGLNLSDEILSDLASRLEHDDD